MDKLSMLKYFMKKIMKVAKKLFFKVLWHFRSISFFDLFIELSFLLFCFTLLLLMFLAAVVNTSAAELPDQIVNAAQLPEQSDPEQPAATPVIDYSEKLQQLDDGLVVLAQYLEQLQLELIDIKSSLTVSCNDVEPDPDYTDQLEDTINILDVISDGVAALLESGSVSENTVSENDIMTTPLSDYSLNDQLLLLIFLCMFLGIYFIVILNFL